MAERKSINISDMEIKFSANGGFKGYASTFGGVDSYDDTILAGAYKGVIERVQRGDAVMPKMFINHRSWEIPVGKWMHMEEDENGLYMEGEFTKGNPQGEIIKAALQHGTVDGLSIGFIVDEFEMVEQEGQRLRIIKSVKELPEVSIVTYPADENARVDLTSVKTSLDNINTVRDFEKFLREVAGFSNSLARETAKSARVLFSQLGVEEAGKVPTSQDDEIKRLIALQYLTSQTL
jgi:uncharacterized protein